MMTVQEYLLQVTQSILSFLEQSLPKIGGESWWQLTVLEKLPEHQVKFLKNKEISDMSAFDQAALLSILEKNWRALAEKNIDLDYRRGLNLIIELKNIRNHYAHEPSTGTALDQKLRDVDSITRLLKMLGADSILIGQGEDLRRELMILLLNIDSGESANGGEEITPHKSSIDSEQHKSSVLETEQDDVQKGVPVHWLKAGTILDQAVLEKLGAATYVGIDFGTSTSVVSIGSVGEDGKGIHTKSVDIRQIDELGREIHSHLVDTCLAWFNSKLLFGVGAARLKQELVANQTIWSSFKMGLGIDLGPEYNRTVLSEGKFEYTIEKPQHAAAVFLKLLCNGVREYVSNNNLPEQVYYTVTVPASFEANQRNDLFRALEFAGIAESEIRLMDEPNAAFLSYLIDMESRSRQGRFVDTLQAKNRNVIVFDFGAGTCDISILEVGVSQASILSRNLGICKFWALGGDDIDKLIAEKILLPQLTGGEDLAQYLFTTTQLEQQILPRLKPVAEALKIRCCELAEQEGWQSISDLKNLKTKVTTKPSRSFVIQEKVWQITEPQIRLDQFAEIMALFVGQRSKLDVGSDVIDVLEPINNALDKVELTKDDIDMVLFIGGSCENPLIRHYVSKHLGRFAESVTPRDLRAHVSQGAALYTLLLRGAGIDPIRPITSETIYVLTAGEQLEPVVRAGTLVPSGGVLEDELEVISDVQKTIDLPFFAGSLNKPLGLIRMRAPKVGTGFSRGEKVKVRWEVNKEKILRVFAEVAGVYQDAQFHNPLANEEVSENEMAMLRAKQAFNRSVLEGSGRPSAEVTLAYSHAAQKAGHWRLAAEMLEAVERLDSNSDHSTNICFCYSKDGDFRNSKKWAEIAYKRRPSAVTAYNLALDNQRNGNTDEFESLMEESLDYAPDYPLALVVYGEYLMDRGDAKGAGYLQKAFDIFEENWNVGLLEPEDAPRFRKVALLLGKSDVLSVISQLQRKKIDEPKVGGFKAINLVGRSKPFSNSLDSWEEY